MTAALAALAKVPARRRPGKRRERTKHLRFQQHAVICAMEIIYYMMLESEPKYYAFWIVVKTLLCSATQAPTHRHGRI